MRFPNKLARFSPVRLVDTSFQLQDLTLAPNRTYLARIHTRELSSRFHGRVTSSRLSSSLKLPAAARGMLALLTGADEPKGRMENPTREKGSRKSSVFHTINIFCMGTVFDLSPSRCAWWLLVIQSSRSQHGVFDKCPGSPSPALRMSLFAIVPTMYHVNRLHTFHESNEARNFESKLTKSNVVHNFLSQIGVDRQLSGIYSQEKIRTTLINLKYW